MRVRSQLHRTALLAVFLTLPVVRPAQAQTAGRAETPEQRVKGPGRALSQYAIDGWDDRHGLPQNSVQAIAQTTDGYLWLGTQDGLVRFDGVRFSVFGRETSPALKRPYIWALEAARDGGLWIGTEEAGLIRQKNGKYSSYTTSNGLPSNWVSALYEASNGQLWIGTRDGGAVRLSNGRMHPVAVRGKNVTGIAEDANGAVYIATMRGLHRSDANGKVTNVAPDMIKGPALSVAVAADTSVWVATTTGMVQLRNDKVVRTLTTADGLPSNVVTSVTIDDEGSVWMATQSGVARYANGQVARMPAGSAIGADIQAMAVDHEGSLWIGTYSAGLMRLRDTPFTPVGTTEGLSEDMVLAVRQGRNGDMWIGTATTGLNRISASGIEHYTVQNGRLAGNAVFSLADSPDGTMWIGTTSGLTSIRDGRSTHYGAKDGLLSPFVRATTVDRNGAVWIGTPQGLQRFRPGTPVTYTTKDGLPDNWIGAILESRDGALWIATRSGLSRMENGKVVKNYSSANGLPDGSVSTLYEDDEGVLWIGTNAGLAQFANGKFSRVNTERGLCDNLVNSILEDDRDRLWIGANRGIFVVSKKDFNATSHGGARLTCTLYGRAEGMRSRETNGAVNPPAWRASDGRMWYSSIKGVVIVDPENATLTTAAPAVMIESLTAEAKRYDSLPLKLPPGTRRMEFQFTGLSFIAPEKMGFRYRLDGYDNGWNDAGARRTATYTNLKPGAYTFRVMAANAAGVWNEQPATYSFTILPLFYQTLWFRAIIGLLFAGLLGMIYSMRVRHLHKRQRSLEALVVERSRAEARYRDLFENATDAVFTVDPTGRFTAMNHKAEQLTGYSAEEATGVSVRSLLPDSAAGNMVYEEWMSGRADAQAPIEICAKDGTRVPVEVSTRLMWDNEKITGMQAIARDVRDRSALERQLRQSQKMEAVGQLAGGVAHDFNNLLTVIRGNGEMLLGDAALTAPVRSDVQEILDAADRATALTRQLLAFSRKQITQPRVVDLNQLILRLEKMMRRLIGEDIDIQLRLSDAPSWVLVDPGQMEQALVNLAVNARDAMPRGGTVAICTTQMDIDNEREAPVRADSGQCVVLSVSDTGTGIDAVTQTRIFEPFFTTKEPGKGTGLGLSTVYGIVQQAGGQTVCRSELGRGTEFRIYLPLTPATPTLSSPVSAERSRWIIRGNETVLLVEDDDAVRTLTRRLLVRQGYTVLQASSGPEALRIADDHPGPIHLLMTDMVMPEMSGVEVADGVRARRANVRVLLMSGYTDDEILRRGIHDPEMAFLNKPFSADELGGAVRDALDRAPGTASRFRSA